MKVLMFQCCGEWYKVSLEPETLGHVTENGSNKWNLPHPSWTILGVSTHHMHNHVTIPLTPDINPSTLHKGYVFDLDHGTTRRWGGSGDCRVKYAYIKEE
jgi:hypothetical protein